MSFGSFKNITYKLFAEKSYIYIYIYWERERERERERGREREIDIDIDINMYIKKRSNNTSQKFWLSGFYLHWGIDRDYLN